MYTRQKGSAADEHVAALIVLHTILLVCFSRRRWIAFDVLSWHIDTVVRVFPSYRYTDTHTHTHVRTCVKRIASCVKGLWKRKEKNNLIIIKKKTLRIHTGFPSPPPLFWSTDLSKRAVPNPCRVDLVIRFAGTFRVMPLATKARVARGKNDRDRRLRLNTAVGIPVDPVRGGYVLRFVRN